MRLGAEDRDAETLAARQLQQFLDRAHAGHAVADHHQMFAGSDIMFMGADL
jgi:hypothetical protein